MAYIGKSIESGTFSVLDTSGNTYNGSNTTFNLGSQVGSPAQLLVSHDGVIQKPGTDYTLATGGTQITFTTAPASGASIFIVEISGAVGGPLDSDLNGTELILDADGDTSITADTDDQIDIKIAGADDFKFSANAMNVLSGSTLTIDSGATIANSGTATGFGVALDDVSTGDAASTLATSAGNITIDAQGGDTDIIFKGTDNTTDITALTIDMSDGGVLQTRAGIGFPATQVANSGANVLDDYEEGTFTGGFSFGGSATGIAYNRQVGIYTKIGNLVFVQGYVSLTSKGSQTGTAQLTGLPFTSSSATNASSAGSMRVAQLTFANDTHLSLHIESGGVVLTFGDTASGAGSTVMDNTNFANNTGIEFGFTYTV